MSSPTWQPDMVSDTIGTLARVGLDDILDKSAWRYWNGERWSGEADQAEELFDGAPIMSASYNEYLQAWTVVYSPPFDRDVHMRTAPELTGPWSRPVVIHTTRKRDDDNAAYDAVHHPEFSEEGGRIEYLTYSRPIDGDERWFAAELALVRVELEKR